jgi:hypothetical protein
VLRSAVGTKCKPPICWSRTVDRSIRSGWEEVYRVRKTKILARRNVVLGEGNDAGKYQGVPISDLAVR